MLFYLFSTEELKEQFSYLGYSFDPALHSEQYRVLLEANGPWLYSESRCSFLGPLARRPKKLLGSF